ncbi:uncharacterized protein [Henckelia pumila]|uniref:uncharacterized protein isoform X2 n=1 Tax=Henckelia pumila TaxID=405737 RepID=UPI003C6DC4C0
MDEFGVLVQSIGFKANGKSAPMAKSKTKPNSHFNGSSGNSTSSFNDSSSLPVDELDGIFRSNVNIHKSGQPQNLFGDDDVFGGKVSGSGQYGAIDLESVLNSSNNGNSGGGLHSGNTVGFDVFDDFQGAKPKKGDPVDDLIGNFGVNSIGKPEEKGSGFDDLIPGFGGANSSKNGQPPKTKLSSELNGHSSKSRSTVEDDPFLVFESPLSQDDASWPPSGPSEQGKGNIYSSLDDLDEFAAGGPQNDSRTNDTRTKTERTTAGSASNGFQNVDDLDAIFSGGKRQDYADSLFGTFFQEEKITTVKQTPSGSSSSTSIKSSAANIGGDFTSLFGDVTTSSGEFHEIEGEPEERRRARLNRHMRMYGRMAQALDDKNQRDFQIQLEQEEKHRLAETLDNDIRRWAAGKEGNLRALLSSLQQVLWPECGWKPVSLTYMITSDSVKKVYKKATLYVHPDKVQQKGANIQQKYIAEKVFDLLKEAWNKFSADELR